MASVESKDMNKEKDFVYLVTVVRSALSMMIDWLNLYEKLNLQDLKQSTSPCTYHWSFYILLLLTNFMDFFFGK